MRFPWLLCLSLLAVALSGCAGYRLGSTNGLAAGAKSVRVNSFQNETAEPRLVEPVLAALRKSLQQDGTFRLSTRGESDVVVNGVLLRYEREGVSFQPNDILTARDFRIRMVARVTAVERSTGKTLLDREVTGRTTVRAGADLSSAERQAVPLLAEDLAKNITSLLVDGEW